MDGSIDPFLVLSYDKWLNLDEPDFFNHIQTSDRNNWLYTVQDNPLELYSRRVSIIKVGDKLYKLDGRKRKKLWATGIATPPQFVVAEVYEISAPDFEKLLTPAATKKATGELTSKAAVKACYEELGLRFQSTRLTRGFIKEALDIALRGKIRTFQNKRLTQERNDINLTKAISLFRDELLFIDLLDFQRHIFLSGVLAAVLIMLALHKDNGKLNELNRFFMLLNNEQGYQNHQSEDDPVASLLKTITLYKQKPLSARLTNSSTLCRISLHAMECWLDGPTSPRFWRKRLFSGIDLMKMVKLVRETKGITHDYEV